MYTHKPTLKRESKCCELKLVKLASCIQLLSLRSFPKCCLGTVWFWITTHLTQRPCYQWRSLCQDPADSQTTRKPPDHHKEMQTAVVWSCLPFIRLGQNHLAGHSERGKKTRQIKEEVRRQHQGMDRPGVWQVPEGSGDQERMEEIGCKIICGAPTTLMVKG